MTRKSKRALLIGTAVAVLAVSGLLVMAAMREYIVFFHTPTEIMSGKVPAGQQVRIGGLVEKGSLKRQANGLDVTFRVTDGVESMAVSYGGILPDLFREGQGVVAEGKYDHGLFVASTILAKHDENYKPPEVSAALQSRNPYVTRQ